MNELLKEIKESAEAIYKYGYDENTVRSEAEHIINLCNEVSVGSYEEKASSLIVDSINKTFLG